MTTAREKMILKIRSTSLASIKISNHGRNRLLAIVLDHKGIAEPSNKKFAETAKSFTLDDAIAAVENNGYGNGYLFSCLIAMGMNYLDWKLLPPETASTALGKLTKEEILDLDVRVLQAFSHKALRNIGSRILKKDWLSAPDLPHITIAELVNGVTYSQICGQYYGSFVRSFVKAKAKLESLGFGYDDGIFFQESTIRKLKEDIAAEFRIPKSTALTTILIAVKKGWIKKPLG